MFAPTMTEEQKRQFNDTYKVWQWNEMNDSRYLNYPTIVTSIDYYPEGSEFGTRRIQYFEYNKETNQYGLAYYDVYIINSSGKVVADYKQGDYPNTIMNDEWKTAVVKEKKFLLFTKKETEYVVAKEGNTISKAGCYISSIADVASYYGKNKTPVDIDTLADNGKYYKMNSPELAGVEDLIKYELSGKYRGIDNLSEFRTTIEERISQGKPTIVRVQRQDNTKMHFAVVSGARYNASGEITQYLLSDPGTRDSSLARINVNDLSYVKDPTRHIIRVITYDK